MALQQLLVHLTGQPTDRDRLNAALALAAEHNARVEGVFVYHQIAASSAQSVFIPEQVFAVYEREVRALAGRVGDEFRDRLGQTGVGGDWHFCRGPTDREIDRQARFADLVVVGQNDEHYGAGENATINRHVALGVSRPLLFVPYIGAPAAIGKRVLVAWNGSAEAARAVKGALPLLARAEQVKVLSINEASDDVPGADLCVHLARHGVTAEAGVSVTGEISVGDCLLSYAADQNVDLIVMGAYGRGRAYEAVLGGATRNLLEHMTVPVLMAR